MCDPTLIGLPREIRDEIYKLVLFEHEVIYPYDYGESSRYNPRMFRHGPQIAILRVNRQLNAEGTEVLYGKGCFYFSTGIKFDDFFNMSVCRDKDLIPPSRHLIRNLEFTFTRGKFFTESLDPLARSSWADLGIRFDQRLSYIHDSARKFCKRYWEYDVAVLEELRSLQDLTINIGGLFCPIGCCRMLDYFAIVIVGLGHTKLKIGIRGQTIEGENAEIAAILNGVGTAEATDLEEEIEGIEDEKDDEDD